MNVKGTEIPADMQERACQWMREHPKHGFTMFQLECFFKRELPKDLPGEIANRAADRILQRERKAGRIKIGPMRLWYPATQAQ